MLTKSSKNNPILGQFQHAKNKEKISEVFKKHYSAMQRNVIINVIRKVNKKT